MKKISFKDLKLSGAQILSRDELKKISGGDGYCPVDQVKWPLLFVDGVAVEWGCLVMSGSPGGDNGDPCPTYCEPVGGNIFCLGNKNGTSYTYSGNCNQLHPNLQGSHLHNACINDVNGSFWC